MLLSRSAKTVKNGKLGSQMLTFNFAKLLFCTRIERAIRGTPMANMKFEKATQSLIDCREAGHLTLVNTQKMSKSYDTF